MYTVMVALLFSHVHCNGKWQHFSPVHYSPLQSTTAHYSPLQSTTVHYSPLQSTKVHYSPLQSNALSCTALACTAQQALCYLPHYIEVHRLLSGLLGAAVVSSMDIVSYVIWCNY